MRRREFIAALGGAAALRPFAAAAQQPKMPVIGVLSVDDPGPLLSLLREGLRERGYVEGQNLRIEVRSGPGNGEVLRPLADELVCRRVEVIVARLTLAVQAAKAATQTIPIVMAPAGAPVETGLTAGLARPGGNVTGLSDTSAELGGKRMQLIREMLPNAQRIAILANAANPFTKPFVAEIELAGRTLSLQTDALMVNRREEIEAAFTAIINARADGIILQASIPADPVVDLALQHRLPLFSATRPSVEAGALMCYTARYDDLYRAAAVYVDKILKGAKPADLPVEQPTRFELVINLKTAKVLGLTVPQSLLTQADEVIE